MMLVAIRDDAATPKTDRRIPNRVICFDLYLDPRNDSNQKTSIWIAIFRDVQFWVPLVVLLIGLLLLSIAR